MATKSPLCGLWVDGDGIVHLVEAGPDGSRTTRTTNFSPFFWVGGETAVTIPAGGLVESLGGIGPFGRLAHAASLAVCDEMLAAVKNRTAVDVVRPWECQFLMQTKGRLFADLSFGQLRRCQLDIETASASGGFSDAEQPEDRVLAIGLSFGKRDRILVLHELSDAAERALLQELNALLATEDPDTIEGHNIFKFDLDYLRRRAKRLGVKCAWGRFGQLAKFRSSRLKVAERWVDFPRCDLPGRTVVDTYLLVQLYDITSRELTAFGLKDAAVHFGVTKDESAERTYIAGDQIQVAYAKDREHFLAYLTDDLRETRGVADVLLPTYFEQVHTFPMLLQEVILRGTTGKIDLLFLEHYYHARQACPMPVEVATFEGGYTRNFEEGVFRHVLHFDIASLYPSLLLHLGRNPANDTLGVFMPLLQSLREYRLKYKQLARSAETAEERGEYAARQASFKILINSFYGYLGFSGARFGDGTLAAEVTRMGRELLQALIDELARQGARILEADTDGIYVSAPSFFDQPEELLAKAAKVLPAGIELEYDGRYEAMFCYKAKNYALYDGEIITLKGSALRSRGIEPFLQELSDGLIRFLLGATMESPLERAEALRRGITAGTVDVKRLAKREALSMNPDAYERFVAGGGKPRRASAEAALQLTPRPRMGDRVTYYILPKQRGQTNDWQRARPVALFDRLAAPYDPSYYLKKLDDWLERYGTFLGAQNTPKVRETQGELL